MPSALRLLPLLATFPPRSRPVRPILGSSVTSVACFAPPLSPPRTFPFRYRDPTTLFRHFLALGVDDLPRGSFPLAHPRPSCLFPTVLELLSLWPPWLPQHNISLLPNSKLYVTTRSDPLF